MRDKDPAWTKKLRTQKNAKADMRRTLWGVREKKCGRNVRRRKHESARRADK